MGRSHIKEVRQAVPDDPDEAAVFMAETLLSYAVEFRDGAGHLDPVDRHKLVASFCKDRGLWEGYFPFSPETADTILAQLAAHGLI